jgi:hypothetical protein
MSEDNGKLNVEDPMKGSVIITIIQSPEKPIRIESNAATEPLSGCVFGVFDL